VARLRRAVLSVAGACALVFLMLYMGGTFTVGKIGPESRTHGVPVEGLTAKTARAEIETITEFYEAVGTLRPRTETSIEAQVTGRILDVLVRPGDRITTGKLLVVLDSREFQARLDAAGQGYRSAKARKEQARQGVLAAEAVHAQAVAAFKRVETYYEAEAATSQELEQAESSFLQARAALQQAHDALREAEAGVNQAEKIMEQSRIALGYARISAAKDGEVVRRSAEPGDLAWPGKPLLVLQTRGTLRLEALVREGLINSVPPGTRLGIVISALNKTVEGSVEEVVPSADPLTRTFLVKVALSEDQAMYPGMFGRLLVPFDRREVVVVPSNTITRIGQLDVVRVREKGVWQKIYVTTGRHLPGDRVEVLSGLDGGEVLAVMEEGNA